MVERTTSTLQLERLESHDSPVIAGAARGWLEARSCQAVFDALDAGVNGARAVGGAVRNALIGVPVADVDIATVLRPEAVSARCLRAGLAVHPTGLAHGTVTVVSEHIAYEVTTLRRDVETDGRRAVVAFAETWEEDAQRRDFTINALYCDRSGCILDPLGGLEDLRARRVRFIGSAHERIREDYLRILRFFRFHAAYGQGQLDRDGLSACRDERHGLAGLSAERIRAEVLKLLVAPGAEAALRAMVEIGLDGLIFGVPGDLACFQRVCALEAAVAAEPSAVLRLAALAAPTAERARELGQRLRLSNSEKDLLLAAAGARESPMAARSERVKAERYRLLPELFRARFLMSWQTAGGSESDAQWRSLWDLGKQWQPPCLPFKGGDLMDLGVTAGPEIGRILKTFEAWWIENGFPSDTKLLNQKLKSLI